MLFYYYEFFVFGVSAEDTVIADGIEDATGELGSLVDRIGKKWVQIKIL